MQGDDGKRSKNCWFQLNILIRSIEYCISLVRCLDHVVLQVYKVQDVLRLLNTSTN